MKKENKKVLDCMSKKTKEAREEARQILKKGILDMSIGRLIQMSECGLCGYIDFESETTMVQNSFNCIDYDEESDVITFIRKETDENCYCAVSFIVASIIEISGCEDADEPDKFLNINIKLDDDTTIEIQILY